MTRFPLIVAARAAALALVLAVSAAPAAWAGDPTRAYAAALTTLASSAGGQPIGTVLPGAALSVLASDGDFAQVSITGWSPTGGERYLFKAVAQRISLAKLTRAGAATRQVIGSAEDDWGSDWDQVTVTGWVARADLAADIETVWNEASPLYFGRCSRCHSLRRPEEFTANQWPTVLKIMTKRAGFNADQAALVTMLLQYHAKDQQLTDAFTAEEASAPTEQTAPEIVIDGTPELAAQGAGLFTDIGCNACHGDDAKTPPIPEYPKLAGQNAEYLYKQITDFRSGARTNDEDEIMRGTVADLSDDDAKALAWWISQQ